MYHVWVVVRRVILRRCARVEARATRVKEEISEESSASDDDGYPTRLGKLEVRETVPRSLQVAGAFRRRDKVVDKTSI